MNKLTNFLPPKEIYDVLHDAECKGIKLPESVEEWWKRETVANENGRVVENVLCLEQKIS